MTTICEAKFAVVLDHYAIKTSKYQATVGYIELFVVPLYLIRPYNIIR